MQVLVEALGLAAKDAMGHAKPSHLPHDSSFHQLHFRTFPSPKLFQKTKSNIPRDIQTASLNEIRDTACALSK